MAKVKRLLGIIVILALVISGSALFFASFVFLPAQADEPPEAEKIEELQQWVDDQGYNYTVAENWVTQLSPEEREALCGYRELEAPEEPLPENMGFFSDVPALGAERLGQPPSSYDAMALGYVTPVKAQLSCGSCWIFGATADFESDVAIAESSLLDFAEQEVGDCNIWSSVGGYNWCLGGNAFMTTNFFTKYGSADETCHPYVATPGTCQNCPLLRNVDNWRMITGSNGESQITTIKNAILSYGPVHASMYASDPGFSAYSSGVYEFWGPYPPPPAGPTDHIVQIIGWDDTKPWSTGTGAWMIKNSWGTSWGVSGPYPGCAWVAYGAANLGDFTSAISGYGNPPLEMFYHDEGGWVGGGYGTGTTATAYGAVRFTPSQNETLTAVDFWANDVNMGYEIKIFDTLNDLGGGNYSFSSQLGTTQTGTTVEGGYYSIPLSTPVSLTSGDDFIVQVKLTTSTSGWYYPIPIDYHTISWLPSIATFSGESYFSSDGTQFIKPSPYDVGIRARAEDTAPPTVISPSPEADATDVAVDTTVSATFSEAIDASTITTGSFTLDGVSGSISYDSGTYTATFTPDANLPYSTTYTATLSTDIADVAGNPLASAYSWSFITEAAPNTPPEVTNVTASQSSPIVDITYDVNDAEQSEVSISFEYWDGSSWQACITTTGEWTQSTGTGKSGTWNAKTDFDEHYMTDCKIRVTADDGQAQNNTGTGESSDFTLDTKDPTGYGCSTPANGATDVSVNPDLTCLTASDDSLPISYYFQLAENDTFTQDLQESGWQTETTWSPSTLGYNKQYFWRVKAKDSYGNETDYSSTFNFTTEPAYDIPLFAGWNLIGLPLIPESQSIEDVLADISVDGVAAYDGATQTWYLYSPGAPSDLTEMTHGKGYWIKVNNPCTLTIEGGSE